MIGSCYLRVFRIFIIESRLIIMQELGLKELKAIELDILQYIHEICEKNKLEYSLAYGTLLGAIRHKGFIPWDDDIDIIMPRESYVKLYQILECDSRYKMLTWENENYCYSWGKVVDLNTVLIEKKLVKKIRDYGVHVDIFPIDGVGNSKFSILCFFIKKYILNMLRASVAVGGYKTGGHRIYHAIVNTVAQIKNGSYWAYRLDKSSQKYMYTKSKYVQILSGDAIPPWRWSKVCSYVFLKKDIEEFVEIEFEGRIVKSVKSWDKFLRKVYGEYMKLPPESERIASHDYVAWIKEEITE